MSRALDVIVYGATGFTGRLVAFELCKRADIKVGLAGRNQNKLEALSKQLQPVAKCASMEVMTVAVTDTLALEKMCRRGRVVIACAGPFSVSGMPVADACVAAGTHYVDITGEFPFVRSVVEKHHVAAENAKVFVVPCGGFDCVASDIANHYTHRVAAQRATPPEIRAVEAAVGVKGGASRGTMESIAHLLRTVSRKDLHPYCLVPPLERKGRALPPREMSEGHVAFHPHFNKYRGPFVMAPVNERVVRRSDYLAGRNVAYSEMSLGSWTQGQRARLAAAAVLAARYDSGLALLRRFMFPAEGDGPSDAVRQSGGFAVKTLAYSTARGSLDASAKPVASAGIAFNRDAYTFTAVSSVETALAIIQGETMPGVQGGVLTPAAAVGDALLARLKSRGMKFKSRL
jgi:short subunit dehydrogenase-like uncharacterized protein